MNKKPPGFSIIIPAYNADQELALAIKSLKKNILNVITSAVGENSQEVRDSLKKYVVNNMSLIIAEEARLQKQNTRESKEQLRNINDVIQEVKMM